MAPMAGITDLPFRLLCKKYGCALTYTEMVSAKGLYYKDKKTGNLLTTVPEEDPVAVQIFGSEPQIISEVIKEYLNNMTFKIIDLNCGCPAPKITKNGEGSALLKKPQLIGEIIYSMVKAANKPVTLKVRSGWDESSINTVEVARIAQQAGASAITVHPRTREQYYGGNSNWNIIKEVKSNVSIPVIGNGDVKNYDEAITLFDISQCDGIMIGRGALGNPWIFEQLLLKNSTAVSPEIRILTVLDYMDDMLKIKPEHVVVKEIRKHISWYIKSLKNAAELRNKVNRCDDIYEIRNMLIKFYKEYSI